MGTPAYTDKHYWLQHAPGGQPRPGSALCEDMSTALLHSTAEQGKPTGTGSASSIPCF